MNNNWQKQYIVLSWDHFQHLVFKLAQKIKRSTRKFDLIVTIARGGLALSQILSDILNLPVAAFTAQSYFDLKQQKIPQVTYGLATSLTGKRGLLADEVCDTGKTFLKGIEYLQSLQAKKQDITTCCLHYKLHAVYQPDFYVDRTSKWIIYPSEIFETMRALLPVWQKQDLSIIEIKRRFLSLDFPKEQVEKFFNEKRVIKEEVCSKKLI